MITPQFKTYEMPKTCKYIGCKNAVFSNDYCQFHQFARTDSKWLATIAARSNRQPIARTARRSSKPINYNFKPIAKESKSRAAINRLYEARSRIFREEKKICEVCPVLKAAGIKTFCSGKAEAVHHTRGKATIELLLKEIWWLASCFWGNGWIEDNSEKAFELQLKLPDYTSKLSKFKK
jgi:hypothetical protein